MIMQQMAEALVIHGERDLRLEPWPVREMGKSDVLVAIRRGGICGSDMHYYFHGGFGTVRVRQPMVLGHEISGEILDVGSDVSGLSVGDRIAVSPSRPDWTDQFSKEGMPHHSMGMRFYGSAMPMPHIQGGYRTLLVADQSQCQVANDLSFEALAMAEPLSVVLHALNRAGSLQGKRVLITGCGPIGCLAIMAARRAGAGEIVATDISDTTLAMATKAGADRTINTANKAADLDAYAANKGYFHVLFECSGAQPALLGALPAVRPQGVVVQLGLGGDMTLPMNFIVSREIDLRGSFRFHFEFEAAVNYMKRGLIDVSQLVTHTFSFRDFTQAFDTAADRSKAMKVQLDFTR